MTTMRFSDLLDIERDVDDDRARATTTTPDVPDADPDTVVDDDDEMEDDDESDDEVEITTVSTRLDDAKNDVTRVAREISSDETAIDGSEKGLIYPGPGA